MAPMTLFLVAMESEADFLKWYSAVLVSVGKLVSALEIYENTAR